MIKISSHKSFLTYVCSPDFVSQKVCEKIVEHFPSACLIMVNNGQLSKQMHQPAIYIMQHFDGKWKVKDKDR